MASNKKYGLLGKRLDYSFSKNYFTRKFEKKNIDASYENIEVQDLGNIKEHIASKDISGFNITTPYKKRILEFVDAVSPIVQEIGASNCIEITETNEWIGHNTDVIGFEKSLKNFIENKKIKALIFGTGGASKAVQYVLSKLEIKSKLVSRNDYLGCIQYQDLNKDTLEEYKLLINTTPVGTYPNVEDCINIPFEFVGHQHYCFDLVYNPEKSEFLTRAQNRGAKIINGEGMLKIQAEESYKIWTS